MNKNDKTVINEQAEIAILAKCLDSNKLIDVAAKNISPSDFYSRENAVLFSSIISMNQQNRLVDEITLAEYCSQQNLLNLVGGTPYIFGLTDKSYMSDMSDYTEVVRRSAEKRRVKSALEFALSELGKDNANVRAIADKARLDVSVCVDNRDETGLINLSEYYSDRSARMAISTGIEALDLITNGFEAGHVTVLSGKTNCGKSVLLSMFALSAIDKGYPVCFYSGELATADFQDWIYCQAAGADYTDKYYGENGAELWRANYFAEQKIREWSNGKLYLYDSKIVKREEQNSVLERFTRALEYGCKLFFVDNLMTAKLPESETETLRQTEFMKSLCEFAKRHDVHVILAAHQRKDAVQGEEASNDSVSGTSNIANLASNVFFLQRVETDGEKLRNNGADATIRVTKGRLTGIRSAIPLKFDRSTRRYSAMTGITKSRYGWR